MSDVEYKEELSETGERTGVEFDDEEELIHEPFDPNTISIEQKPVPMDTLLRRLKQGSLKLSPDFQREEVWNQTRQSRLIESLILRIPLPMFYVAADKDGNWEVVDGLQRISTIRNFILGDKKGKFLSLKNLEFLEKKLKGKTFKSIENDPLHQKLLNTIHETELRFTVINPGTPEEVKRNIFKRINTGGMPLTAQEIRHALYQGHSTELLTTLVETKAFKEAIGRKINDTRMAARELIIRFLSFEVLPRSSYASNMDSWLSNAMQVMNLFPEIEPTDIEKIYTSNPAPSILCRDEKVLVEKFRIAMERSQLLFDGHAFRKSLPSANKKAPVNKALFETWSNILCSLEDYEFDTLLDRKSVFWEKYEQILADADFNNFISRHSSQPKGVKGRFEKLYALVNEVLGK